MRHTTGQFSTESLTDFALLIFGNFLQSLDILPVASLNVVFQDAKHIFHRIEIRAVCWYFHLVDSVVEQPLMNGMANMVLRVVLQQSDLANQRIELLLA